MGTTGKTWQWSKGSRENAGAAKTLERNQEIARLHKEGVMGTELAKRFGISRQRVYQILDAMKKLAVAKDSEVG